MTIISPTCSSTGSQDYTRARFDLGIVPELPAAARKPLSLEQESSQFSTQSWSGIRWGDEAPETSSPVKQDLFDSENEEQEEEQDSFKPYTQSSVVRPITWAYSQHSESYGSEDYIADPTILDILARVEREEEKSAPSAELIESFTPSPREPLPLPLVASYASSSISSFTQEIARDRTPRPIKKVHPSSIGLRIRKNVRLYSPASLSRSDTYSSADFGEGVLNLKNLSQRTLQTIDAIEASYVNKNKRKNPDFEPVTPKKQVKRARVSLSPKKPKIGVDLEGESQALQCWLCGKLLANPQLSSSCGHTLGCNYCVVRWIMKRGSQTECPQSGCGVIIDSIIPNYGLNELIRKHVKLLHECYFEWDEEKRKLRKDWAKRLV